MRYTTWEDVIARYPTAANIAKGNTGEAFERAFCQPAEATIDANLAIRYTVPLCDTPTLAPYAVFDIATDLTYWKMAWMGLDERIEKTLRESIDQRLKDLATGSASLVNSAGLVAPKSLGAFGTHADFANVAGMDDVVNWGVSSLELSSLEDARGD